MAMLNNQIVRACVQLGMMKPNRQKTFFFFVCWMQGTHPVFTCCFTKSTALHCCEGCYMLLHVVTRFAVWLGVTAHGLQSETSLNMLWVSENDAMPKLMAYHQYHQYHHIRHFFGRVALVFHGLQWFLRRVLSETGRLQYLAKFAFSFWSIESPFVLVNVCSLGVAK